MKGLLKPVIVSRLTALASLSGCQTSHQGVTQKTQTEAVDALKQDFQLVETITGAPNSIVSLNESGWAKTFVAKDSLGTTVVTISNMASYHATMSRTGGPTMGLLENEEDYFIWEERHPHPEATQPGELPKLMQIKSKVVTDPGQRAIYLELLKE